MFQLCLVSKHLDIVNWFMGDDNSIKRDIITILNLIDKQETRIKELEEINTEHQTDLTDAHRFIPGVLVQIPASPPDKIAL